MEHLFECEANYQIKRVQRKLCDPADKFAYRNRCGALTACQLTQQSHTGPDPSAPPPSSRSGSGTATLLPVFTHTHTPCVMCGNIMRGINLIWNYCRPWLALSTAALWKFKAFRHKLTQHELTLLESCTLLSSRLTELCPDSYQ